MLQHLCLDWKCKAYLFDLMIYLILLFSFNPKSLIASDAIHQMLQFIFIDVLIVSLTIFDMHTREKYSSEIMKGNRQNFEYFLPPMYF